MKVKSLIAIILMILLAAGCSGGAETPATSAAPATEEEATEAVASVEASAMPTAEGPIALTSAGQSADVKMIEALVKKVEMAYTIDTVMTEEGLGEAKTLILAIGGSSKGLGAAGINANDELERIDSLIAAAKGKGMTVIGMHVGGEGRRGELSDKFINAAINKVDYLVFVESGNADGLMSDAAQANGIHYESVDNIAGSIEALQKAFQ